MKKVRAKALYIARYLKAFALYLCFTLRPAIFNSLRPVTVGSGRIGYFQPYKSRKIQELCRKACGVKIKCVNLRHLTDGYTNSITSELAEVL